MLRFDLLKDDGILVVEPRDALTADDFRSIARTIDPHIEEHGKLSGLLVDAVLLAEDDVSIVFSYTRSYFHVDLERVAEAVVFLRSIMPRKPVSELFTVLGRARAP